MPVTTHLEASSQATVKETLQAKTTFTGHGHWIQGLAFIPGTRLFVTCSGDRSLRVWNLDTGQQVGKPLLHHDHEVRTVAASPDGRWIVRGGMDGTIVLWEVGTNEGVPVLLRGHGFGVESVVFAPDSDTFASSSSWDETVRVWKRETGKTVFKPLRVGSRAYSVSYSPDGSRLAAGTEKHIIVWNTASAEELWKVKQRAWRVAFTPDGLRLVSGDVKDIRISDAATGDIIKRFDAHTQIIISLAIAPNGTKFATSSYDKTTRFFDLNTFEPIGEPLEHPDVVWGVAFSEDSQLIATGCWDNLVRTWTVPQPESESDKESRQNILKACDTFDAGVANNRASNGSAQLAGTFGVISGTSTVMQTSSVSASAATNRPPSPPDVEEISCLAALGRCFPRLPRSR